METIYPCCAGLDIHKRTVVACVRRVEPTGRAREWVQTFGTMTGELLALSDWLAAHGVTHVAIESTGVFWKPTAARLVASGRFRLSFILWPASARWVNGSSWQSITPIASGTSSPRTNHIA
jgi:hypothetical protein